MECEPQTGVLYERFSAAVGPNGHVRLLSGLRMKTLDGFFREFASAFGFPGYFGMNYPAFAECREDLPDWLPGAFNVAVVFEAEHVLSQEPIERATVAGSFDFVNSEQARLAPHGPVTKMVLVTSSDAGHSNVRGAWDEAAGGLARLAQQGPN